MNKPRLKKVMEVMQSKNYRIYDSRTVDWNINIVGIRAKEPIPNRFDDWLLVFHQFGGVWDVRYYQITTDPSPFFLRNPRYEKGTAILKEDQYKGAYKLDIHKRGRKGGHKALCQRHSEVSVYRDRNRDGTMSFNSATVESGMFGINIHRGPRNAQWNVENTRYSEGCQVFADDRKFNEFIRCCEEAKKAFGNKFTYTLLNERDFE